MRYGRSISFTDIEIGTNRKPVCDFLLENNYVTTFDLELAATDCPRLDPNI